MPAKWLTKAECEDHLHREVYGRLATSSRDEQPYITPVNFVYHNDHIYIHVGLAGQKLRNIAENSKVCFEISGAGNLQTGPRACNFTIQRWSVLVFGTAMVLSDQKQKLAVMQAFMDKYAAGYKYTVLSLQDMDSVNVLSISISEMTGKAH